MDEVSRLVFNNGAHTAYLEEKWSSSTCLVLFIRPCDVRDWSSGHDHRLQYLLKSGGSHCSYLSSTPAQLPCEKETAFDTRLTHLLPSHVGERERMAPTMISSDPVMGFCHTETMKTVQNRAGALLVQSERLQYTYYQWTPWTVIMCHAGAV